MTIPYNKKRRSDPAFSLLHSGCKADCKLPQKAIIPEIIQGAKGQAGILLHHLLALFQAVEPDEGILFLVRTHGFSHLIGRADDIQHIIPDLESKPQIFRKSSRCFDLLLRTVAGNYAKNASCFDQSTGFAALDVNDFLLITLPLLTQYIQHLTANHAIRTCTPGKQTDCVSKSATVRQLRFGSFIESIRQKSIAS